MKTHIFKPKTVQLLLIITILFLNIGGCTKRLTEDERWNPQLPPITQTGENTFGCKINGKIMVPRDGRKDPLLGGYPYGVGYGSGADYNYIEAIDRYTSRGGVAFRLPNIDSLKTGEYLVETIKGGFSSFNHNIVYMGAIYYGKSPTAGYSSIKGTGKIIITRYDDEVISGIFYCKLNNNIYPKDTIKVTEGRFDFNKKTIYTTKFR